MKQPKLNRRWIPGIVFWVLFLGSLALDERYPWVRTAWIAAWLLFLVVVAVVAVVKIFRHRHDTGGVISYRGASGWVATLFGDGPEPGDNHGKKLQA
ncbi:MAG TPA: hypothetical protein VNZ03_16920 [Terriglobales bacterium]|nr:hypothetical protein [Terriglobales bacterium]